MNIENLLRDTLPDQIKLNSTDQNVRNSKIRQTEIVKDWEKLINNPWKMFSNNEVKRRLKLSLTTLFCQFGP